MGMDQQQLPMSSLTPSGNQLSLNFTHSEINSVQCSVERQKKTLFFDLRRSSDPTLCINAEEKIKVSVELGAHTSLNIIVCDGCKLHEINIFSQWSVSLRIINKNKPLFISRVFGKIMDITYDNELRIGALEVILDSSQLIMSIFDRCDEVIMVVNTDNYALFFDKFPSRSIKILTLSSPIYVLTSQSCTFLSAGKHIAGRNYAYLDRSEYFENNEAKANLEPQYMELTFSRQIPVYPIQGMEDPNEFGMRVCNNAGVPEDIDCIISIVCEFAIVNLLRRSKGHKILPPLKFHYDGNGENKISEVVNVARDLLEEIDRKYEIILQDCTVDDVADFEIIKDQVNLFIDEYLYDRGLLEDDLDEAPEEEDEEMMEDNDQMDAPTSQMSSKRKRKRPDDDPSEENPEKEFRFTKRARTLRLRSRHKHIKAIGQTNVVQNVPQNFPSFSAAPKRKREQLEPSIQEDPRKRNKFAMMTESPLISFSQTNAPTFFNAFSNTASNPMVFNRVNEEVAFLVPDPDASENNNTVGNMDIE
jgi:hypothetical protein